MRSRSRWFGLAFAAVTLVTAADLDHGGGRPLIAAAPRSAAAAPAGWEAVSAGVMYKTFGGGRSPLYHVARIDLSEPQLRTFVSGEADRGTTVSQVAARHDAVAVVNGDYFDESLRPIGYTQGPCGKWDTRGPRSSRREFSLVIGQRRATVAPSPDRQGMPDWGEFAISGWPKLVDSCRALSSSELPGSDAFTRAPHARTAVGVDRSGRYLFMITASPTQYVRGATLPELATFMKRELGICQGMNLDGGGSTAIHVGDERRQPEAQFTERPVGNHLVVVAADDYRGCELPARRVARVSAHDRLSDLAEILGGRINGDLILFPRGEARFAGDALSVVLDVPPEWKAGLVRAIEGVGTWSVKAKGDRLVCESRGNAVEATHALQRILGTL